MNQAVYQLACFMIMRSPTGWRWSHTRHDTDTIIVGRDPEIAIGRPARLFRLFLNFFGLIDIPISLAKPPATLLANLLVKRLAKPFSKEIRKTSSKAN